MYAFTLGHALNIIKYESTVLDAGKQFMNDFVCLVKGHAPGDGPSGMGDEYMTFWGTCLHCHKKIVLRVKEDQDLEAEDLETDGWQLPND